MLYDHRPLRLGEDDYLRVCQIPHRKVDLENCAFYVAFGINNCFWIYLKISSLLKGANFRDLPGVIVGADNKAQLDPSIDRKLLPSGRPLVRSLTSTFILSMCCFIELI